MKFAGGGSLLDAAPGIAWLSRAERGIGGEGSAGGAVRAWTGDPASGFEAWNILLDGRANRLVSDSVSQMAGHEQSPDADTDYFWHAGLYCARAGQRIGGQTWSCVDIYSLGAILFIC